MCNTGVNLDNISERVEKLITPIALEQGLIIIDVEYDKKFNGMNLTVIIDKDGGVGLCDCEKFHKAIDGPLDELDPTEGKPYTLNVSSPGLDRQLKKDIDFIRNLGKEIEISFFKPYSDGSKKLIGVLKDYKNKTVLIECGGKTHEIQLNEIAKINLFIKF